MSGRRIDLSLSQVLASVLAAMTGAIAASYLGVTGTLIGAAVLSFASTAGTAVYRHYLGRGQERLRTVAASKALGSRARPRQRDAAGPSRQGAVPTSGQGAAPTRTLASPGAGAGPTAASTPPRPDEPTAYIPATPRPGTPAACAPVPPDAVQTEVLPATHVVSRRTPERWTGDGPGDRGPGTPAGEGQPTGGGDGHTRIRRWLKPVLLTLAVFLVTMVVITVIEAATGRPLDSLVWQRHGSGTTVGNVITGHPGRSHPAGPSLPATAPTSPGPRAPAGSPAANRPSSQARTPTPAPTTSTSPSTSPSPTPSATTAPAPGSSSSPSATPSPTPSGTPAPTTTPSP